MTAYIGDYDMDYIILDLGSDVNILTRQTWERINNPRLDWSPIQLRLAIQLKFLPIGRLTQVPVEVEGLRTYDDFEVFDIIDNKNPYHALLGIDWEIDNQTIINFKKRILSLEDSEIRVVAPIDLLKGHRYFKPVHSEGKENYLYQLYNIMSSKEDYINLTTDRKLSWWSVSSCTSNSSDALGNWQNRIHEVSMRRCARITRVVQRVGDEASVFPTYEGLPNLASFLEEFKEKVTESQRLSTLE